MSTEYYLTPLPSEEELIAKMPAEIHCVFQMEHVVDTGVDKGKAMRRYTLTARDKNVLQMFVMEGKLHSFERFASNRVLAILVAIQKAFEGTVTSNLGAVLGQDDWFDG